MRAVPRDAAFILEAKKPASSLKYFFTVQNEGLAITDSWLQSVKDNFLKLDSLIQQDGDAAAIWKNQSLVISASRTGGTGRFDYLFLSNLPPGRTEGTISKT